jgi:hypothetical protein
MDVVKRPAAPVCPTPEQVYINDIVFKKGFLPSINTSHLCYKVKSVKNAYRKNPTLCREVGGNHWHLIKHGTKPKLSILCNRNVYFQSFNSGDVDR